MKYLRDPETGEDTDESHYIDVAQIISSDFKYVGFAAFWPTTSDYTVDGWADWYHSLTCVPTTFSDDVDMVSEPDIPFLIGEWDFELGYEPISLKQFRAVEVKGVVAYHDAKDIDAGFATNELDSEVKFMLDEVFNPWDLNDAVHKSTKRWVDFFTGDGKNTEFTLTHTPVLLATPWEAYRSFSERVLLNGVLQYPKRAADVFGHWEYYLEVDDTTGVGKIVFATPPPAGAVIKVLYSTTNVWTWNVTDTPERSETDLMLIGTNGVSTVFSLEYTWVDPFGAFHYILITDTFEANNKTGEPGLTLESTEDRSTIQFFKAHPYAYKLYDIEYDDESNELTLNGTIEVYHYLESPSELEPIESICTISITFTHRVETERHNDTTINATLTAKYEISITCIDTVGGRYEWTIVGRTPPARTIDSAGAAMVTAAFKDKQREIGLAGEDIEDGLYVPYVMAKMRTGTDWPAYFYDTGDKRTALRDDWCTTWPVASSNIIGIGGPGSNLLVYYFNEFADAFWGVPEFSVAGWKGKIVALSCWSLNTYEDTEDTGYAVIATYRDLNGTVGFIIWGLRGRDTFYASKWFWEEGIVQMQTFPDCVTAIVLKIDYTTHEPSVTVAECLGTISETLVHGIKGGIHEDP